MATDRRIGSELGGYRIVEQIGHGGTSVVYRAEHVRLGRPAALKLLTPAVGEADFTARFLRESQLAASLDHPNIVPVYDAGEADGLLYIAMAYVDGRDLKTALAEEGKLPPTRAIRIVSQVGAALDAAHARGLIHRDVKPANILVTEGDRAYLSDFGIVKELGSDGTTRTGSFIGTIEYCAPEQIEGRAVDARTDVYALACVLYECLTGNPPFHSGTQVAILNAHLRNPPPRLGKAAPELPQALGPVIAKALSKSPLDRYATCGEFMSAVRTAVTERQVHRMRLAASLGVLAAAAVVGILIGFALGHSGNGTTTTVVRTTKPPTDILRRTLLASQDARTLNDIGFLLWAAGSYDQAIPFLQKSIERGQKCAGASQSEQCPEPAQPTLGYAQFNLAAAQLRVKHIQDGLPKNAQCQKALLHFRAALHQQKAANTGIITSWIDKATTCSKG